jgi:hypothetical protein
MRKISKVALLLLLSILSGCFQEPVKDIQLESTAEKQLFLETIFEKDQGERDGKRDAELVLKYGKDSKEAMAYVEAQWEQDANNLSNIAWYLKTYGYPDKNELGEIAAMTPWVVVHHSTDIGVRNEYFEDLYRAYLREDIDETAFAMYLGRTYEFIHKERLQMSSPYTSVDEINTLIEKLDLKDKKQEIDKSLRIAQE